MGSAVNNCCAENSSQNINHKNKINSIKQSDIKHKKVSKKCNEGENISTKFTQQNILKLLGNLIILQQKIHIQDFQIQGIIGQGAFGIVYLGQLKKNINQGIQEKYAIKRVPKELLLKKKLVNNALDERDILAMCNRFMVSLIMAFQDAWFLYLVMEYAAGGDTYSLIKQGSFKRNIFKNSGQNVVRFIAACVILALQFLHDHKYMYRDLKPQNVLIFSNGYVKLTDFGLAKKSIEGNKSQTISGTQFYYAPQMVLNKGYNKQIDFWTLGVYLYELSNYQPPFTELQISKNNFQAACLAAQNDRVWLNANLSPQLKDLINKLLVFDIDKRLGVINGWQQVKNHAFFKDFEWLNLQSGSMDSPLQKIVNMFPSSIKPLRHESKKVECEQQDIQGWSLIKKNKS